VPTSIHSICYLDGTFINSPRQPKIPEPKGVFKLWFTVSIMSFRATLDELGFFLQHLCSLEGFVIWSGVLAAMSLLVLQGKFIFMFSLQCNSNLKVPNGASRCTTRIFQFYHLTIRL
jgi:hypothetical protein